MIASFSDLRGFWRDFVRAETFGLAGCPILILFSEAVEVVGPVVVAVAQIHSRGLSSDSWYRP